MVGAGTGSAYGTGRSSAVGATSPYGVGTGSAVGAGVDSRPPTAVRYLTTAQLQMVLRGRGVRLPEGSAQSHAYYVELCRSHGLVEVTAAELAGGGPAAAGGPAAHEIVLGVQELVLSSEPRGSSRRLSVRVEALGMEDRPLETPAMVGRGGEAVRFNWSHSIPVAAGNRAWGALARALATTQEEDSDVYFTVRDADTGGSVGEAYVNLERLLKGGVDKVSEAVQVLDAKDRLVGRLTLTVRALGALRTVQAEEQARARGLSSAPPPPPPPPATTPLAACCWSGCLRLCLGC